MSTVNNEFVGRRAGRAVPTTSVTVALLEDNLPVAYGIVRNLSEIGACIMTNTVLRPGNTYEFRMSFFGGEILEAVATIVWSESHHPAIAASIEVPHGLEFDKINDAHLQTLKTILESGQFGHKTEH